MTAFRGNLNHGGFRWSTGLPFLSVVWKPEGLLLTPHSVSAPHGYGFPKRGLSSVTTIDGVDQLQGGEKINPPFGTLLESEEKECLNQVLINRYANNKYLDKFDYTFGLSEKFELPKINNRLRDSVETKIDGASNTPTVVFWPLCYTPRIDSTNFWKLDENRVNWIDEPGENRWISGSKFAPFKKPEYTSEGKIIGEIPGRQFDANGNSLIYEVEVSEWFCHWPEELLYDNDAFEEIFRMTNEYRDAVGKLPVTREIRGYGNLARSILTEMQRAQIQFHDNEDKYRTGYGTLHDRAYNIPHSALLVGENLVSGLKGIYTKDAGLSAAVGWRHSPPHYANMINSTWTETGATTSLDVFGGLRVTYTETGEPYPHVYDPPKSGISFAQLFTKRQSWLEAGYVNQTCALGRTSGSDRTSPIGHGYSQQPYWVYTGGRQLFISQVFEIFDVDKDFITQLGSTLFLKDGYPWIRVLFIRSVAPRQRVFLSYILPMKDIAADWELEAESPVFDDIATTSVSYCSFNSDGSVGVFSTTRLVYSACGLHLDTNIEDYPQIITAEQVAIQYRDGTFSILEIAQGPEITYTVVERTEGVYDYLNRYTQEGEGEVSLFPTYNTDGLLVRLKLNTSVFVEQIEDSGTFIDPIEGKDEVNIYDYITFPSGKILDIVKYHSLNKAFVGPAYFIVIYYLDILTEDVVYGRIDCTSVDEDIYGTLTIYVNEDIVKTFPSQLITQDNLYHRGIYYSSYLGNRLATGIRDLGTIRSFVGTMGTYQVLPSRGPATINHYVRCSDVPSIKHYPGRLLEGTHRMSLVGRGFNFNFCYSGTKDGTNYFMSSYCPSLPLLYAYSDAASCVFARYKDRYVVQFNIVECFNFEIPESEQKFIYANFDLQSLVDIGELTWLHPMGVI